MPSDILNCTQQPGEAQRCLPVLAHLTVQYACNLLVSFLYICTDITLSHLRTVCVRVCGDRCSRGRVVDVSISKE